MKIFLTNQKDRFKEHLAQLKNTTVKDYDIKKLNEKISTIKITISKSMDDLNFDFFFNYELFPETILSAYPQWKDEKRSIEIGDTIVQQASIPPFRFFSQKIIFGVRIKEIVNSSNRKSFSYETLSGHVEIGISIFSIETINSQIEFKIHTFSKPGNFLTKIVGPIFSVPYQTYCTKECLKTVKALLERQ